MDNRRLFLGNIPYEKTERDIERELCKITSGVAKVYIKTGLDEDGNPTPNKGFAFAEYTTHRYKC